MRPGITPQMVLQNQSGGSIVTTAASTWACTTKLVWQIPVTMDNAASTTVTTASRNTSSATILTEHDSACPSIFASHFQFTA